MSFIFGGNTGMSYEDVQRKKALAQALSRQTRAPSNIGEGLHAIGQALAGRALERKAGRRQAELDAKWKEQVSGMGLDPRRAAIFENLPYDQRNAAVLSQLDRMDAERRAAASRGASAARRAEAEAKEARARQAIASAMMGSVQPREGVQMGPTVEAANAGAASGGDLGMLQTERIAPTQQSVVQALIGNPDVPLSTIGSVTDFLPEPPPQMTPYQEVQAALARDKFEFEKEQAAIPEGLTPWQEVQKANKEREIAMRAAGTWSPGTNVDVTLPGSEPAPMIGTIPQGYTVIEDPSNPSGYTMMPIPGGPEDTSQADAAKESARDTASDNVLNAASRARAASQNRNGPTALTGVIGSINPMSDSAEVLRQVQVLKDITSAEALNAMRRQSKTGGALGNVTERELGLLSRQGGALDPNSPNFERDLADYERSILRVIHGKEAGDNIFEATRQSMNVLGDGISEDDREFLKSLGID